MWRKFIVSADKEEWEGVWDDLIEARTHADEFLLNVRGNKLVWLMHKVKAQDCCRCHGYTGNRMVRISVARIASTVSSRCL